MALPTIIFDSSTGSDTTASGDNGAATLNGTAASTTASSATVSLLTDNPDLSSVATDGSQVLWVLSSSGRQFSKITAKDNTAGVKTVTCESTYANTEGSRTWGIGGKRATLDNTNSRKLLTADARPGWTVRLDTNAAATISSAIALGVSGDNTTGPITIKGSAEGRVMNQTANANHFSGVVDYINWENLKFTNSNGTKTSAIAMNLQTGHFYYRRCIFGDATNKLLNAIKRAGNTPDFYLEDCEITTCTDVGILTTGNETGLYCFGCWIHGCTGAGITKAGGVTVLYRCLITGNGGAGVTIGNSQKPFIIIENTINSNSGGDGVDMSAVLFSSGAFVLSNNITANSAFGLHAISGQTIAQSSINYNNYGTGATANTSGALSNLNSGANDLGVDPQYTNTGSNNYGVGANVQDKAFPDATRNIGANQSATVNYSAIGAAEPQVSGGAGGTAILQSGIIQGLGAI